MIIPPQLEGFNISDGGVGWDKHRSIECALLGLNSVPISVT